MFNLHYESLSLSASLFSSTAGLPVELIQGGA